MKIIDLQRGLTFQKDSKDSKFLKELKKIFNLLGIPFNDPCCPGTSTAYPAAIIFITPQDNIPGGTGGEISVTNYLTTINTDAGGDAFTLADGTVIGQLKKIVLVVDGGGDAVVTPANLAAGTTITFDDATDFAVLSWDGTEWFVVENSGTTVT